jgi:hypothetical protein
MLKATQWGEVGSCASRPARLAKKPCTIPTRPAPDLEHFGIHGVFVVKIDMSKPSSSAPENARPMDGMAVRP